MLSGRYFLGRQRILEDDTEVFWIWKAVRTLYLYPAACNRPSLRFTVTGLYCQLSLWNQCVVMLATTLSHVQGPDLVVSKIREPYLPTISNSSIYTKNQTRLESVHARNAKVKGGLTKLRACTSVEVLTHVERSRKGRVCKIKLGPRFTLPFGFAKSQRIEARR